MRKVLTVCEALKRDYTGRSIEWLGVGGAFSVPIECPKVTLR